VDIMPSAAGMILLRSPFVGTVRHHALGCAIHAQLGLHGRLPSIWVADGQPFLPRRDSSWQASLAFLQVHKLSESRSFYFGTFAILLFCLDPRVITSFCRVYSLDTVFLRFVSSVLRYLSRFAVVYILFGIRGKARLVHIGSAGSASHRIATEHTQWQGQHNDDIY
jgi:hypothetical protein